MSRALTVIPARDTARGFDCNFTVTADEAKAFRAHGYEFAVRYVPRTDAAHPYDLTASELDALTSAGLGVMLVQHVESELRWEPYAEKGAAYGAAAAARALALGVPVGAMIWCDLEGVAVEMMPDPVVQYCRAWYAGVANAGFLPGLYVGWHCGLSAAALYHDLPFAHYWASYNLNVDEQPAVRGVQMHQWVKHPADVPAGIAWSFDVDTVLADRLGGLPSLVVASSPA